MIAFDSYSIFELKAKFFGLIISIPYRKREVNGLLNRNGGHRRQRWDIIADILTASYDGVKKTNMMRDCNMSFDQMARYVNFTLETRLIRAENDRGHILFKTSQKGKKFLSAYRTLRAILKP